MKKAKNDKKRDHFDDEFEEEKYDAWDQMYGTKQATARYTGTRTYKCMNCKAIILNPEGDMFSKRFCSSKCMTDYLRT